MQVYKAYFKIIRKRLVSILIYFIVFLLVALLITSMMGQRGTATFIETKNNIALFNEDAGAQLSDGLQQYLSRNAGIVNIQDDEQSIQDALFYGNVSYVLRIPKGFTESFMSGRNDVSLQKTAASGSTSSVYMDFLVDRYLKIADLYVKNAPGIAQEQIVRNVEDDLSHQAGVTVNTFGNAPDTNYLSYYFRYLAYSILAIMIMGVTSFMMAFNGRDLTRRNACAPLKPLNMSLQIMLGNATFAVVVWAALCVTVFLIYGDVPFGPGTALMCLNALAMTVVSLSIGFLAGKFIRDHGVQSAVANVVSLGMSFISGVFVEQELLGKTVLNIARFTPTYWYVKAVDDIRNMAVFNAQNVLPVVYSILIQLGFAVAIFVVAMMLTKQTRQKQD